jgi:hypothetical protein
MSYVKCPRPPCRDQSATLMNNSASRLHLCLQFLGCPPSSSAPHTSSTQSSAPAPPTSRARQRPSATQRVHAQLPGAAMPKGSDVSCHSENSPLIPKRFASLARDQTAAIEPSTTGRPLSTAACGTDSALRPGVKAQGRALADHRANLLEAAQQAARPVQVPNTGTAQDQGPAGKTVKPKVGAFGSSQRPAAQCIGGNAQLSAHKADVKGPCVDASGMPVTPRSQELVQGGSSRVAPKMSAIARFCKKRRR